MNKRQRKSKLKQRRAHQEQVQGQTKEVEYEDGTVITMSRGKRKREGFRRRKVSKLTEFFHESGVQLTPAEVADFVKMARQVGEDAVIDRVKREREAIARLGKPETVLIIEDEVVFPTEEEWAEMVATAKARKKGVAKIAVARGFKQLSNELGPGIRENWARA